jgi:hypothetical protein
LSVVKMLKYIFLWLFLLARTELYWFGSVWIELNQLFKNSVEPNRTRTGKIRFVSVCEKCWLYHRARRVESGSENLRADIGWLRVRANYNLIIIRLSSGFHEKCAGFASHQLQKASRIFTLKKISSLRNPQKRFRIFRKASKWVQMSKETNIKIYEILKGSSPGYTRGTFSAKLF